MQLRNKNRRRIKDVTGKNYLLEEYACGFGVGYTLYHNNGKEIGSTEPDMVEFEDSNIYEYLDSVIIHIGDLRFEFSMDAFYKGY